MDKNQLTPEQVKDIEERVAKAAAFLKELQLQPQASVQAMNMGDDVFAQKVIVYLQDQKYLSPIKKGDL